MILRAMLGVLVGTILAVLAGCGPPPPPDYALVPHLAATAGPGVPLRVAAPGAGGVSLEVRRRHRLQIAHSEREAVVSVAGLVWRATIPAGVGPGMDFTLAGVGPEGAAGAAVVAFRDAEGERELYRTTVRAGTGWEHHRVAWDDHGAGEVVLSSTGPHPIAWADLYLTFDPPLIPPYDKGGHPHPSQETRRDPPPRPNLILISIDTLRADRVSCYGYERRTTPHLDRLAADGYRFTRSFASSTWTLPSTATLLTGLLPDQHRLLTIDDLLADEVVTVAERLRDAGYRTAAITDGGFLRHRWGFAQGFQRYDSTAGQAWEPKDVAVIATAAREWLRQNRFQPFFLFVHTYEPHQPYRNPEGFADPFLDPDYRGPLSDEVEAWTLARRGHGPEDRRWVEALYDGEVARADHYLGRMLETVRELGLYDRTAIVVTSDHGEEFLEHGGVEHGGGKVFNENVEVPLIVKPPGGGDGSEVSLPVTGLDVAPALLEIAGVPVPPAFPGSSLLALIAAGDRTPRAVLVHGLNSFPSLNEERYRLDLGDEAVVFDRVRGRAAAYDLAADPEMHAPRAIDQRPWTGALARLHLALAWARPEGRVLTQLPADCELLVVPPSSGVVPRGIRTGLEWQPADGERTLRLSPGRPHTLVFDFLPGRGGLLVELMRSGRREVQSLARHRVGSGWTPLDGPLPPPLTVLETAASHRSATAELDEEDRRELRALGYLQ